MDQNRTIFRVEAYRGDDFAGMFLVCFGRGAMSAQRETLPGVPGPESDFGK
jgi:hypothetical protein